MEIKFSTLWKSGVYKFQQIRDQEYDAMVLLGISPFSAACWIVPKAETSWEWRAIPAGLRDGGSKG